MIGARLTRLSQGSQISESNQIKLTSQFFLRDVLICHFMCKQRTRLTLAPKKELILHQVVNCKLVEQEAAHGQGQ